MSSSRSNLNAISNYLSSSQTPLGKIIQRASYIAQLQIELQAELPVEFASHFWVGNYQEGLLSLLVDSGALATKLRFALPELRDQLRKKTQWAGLKSIRLTMMVEVPQSQ